MSDQAPILSIIIPCLNEAAIIQRLLDALQPMRAEGHELILVDGGSTDGTQELAAPLVDRLLPSEPGRARQMNLGARAGRGEAFWFLHADTVLSPQVGRSLLGALGAGDSVWGRFDVELAGRHPLLPAIAFMINLRSRLSGIATGDQGLFVRRQAFEAVAGFPQIPLMEDIAISRRLKRIARPLCLRERLLTSGRRWEAHGVFRTILLMWGLRLAYALGVSPARLAQSYRPCNFPTRDS